MSFIINPYSFGVALHPMLVAWLARGTALGYTLPSAAQQQKLNTFFYALESGGFITGTTTNLLDVLYIFAIDGSSDMATLNVIDPTLYQATKVNSPTFTSNQGFTGNGTTSYLDSNWIPSTNGVNFTTNSCGYGLYVNSAVQATQIDCGATRIAGGSFIQMNTHRLTGGVQSFLNDATGFQPANPGNSIGFYHSKRTASNSLTIYKDGVSLGSSGGSVIGAIDRTIWVCRNNPTGAGSTRQIGMFWAGASLNGLESSFYTAWNTYFTSL